MTTTIAIANHKGGVGKTATTQALGEALSNIGRRVLLADLDPQSSLTGATGHRGANPTLADVLGGATPGRVPLQKCVIHLQHNLDLAPSSLDLAATELGLISRMGRENALIKALSTVHRHYDIVLIDCPPSLGLLTINALTAANYVLIPTQPAAVDLAGLSLFLETVERVRDDLNPELGVLGIVATFYDARLKHHKEAIAAMQRANLPLLPVTIGRSVRVQEAASEGRSVIAHSPHNQRASEYKALAELIDGRL